MGKKAFEGCLRASISQRVSGGAFCFGWGKRELEDHSWLVGSLSKKIWEDKEIW